MCPGRDAARSGASQSRDRSKLRVRNGPGPAAPHFVLRCVRDKLRYRLAPRVSFFFPISMSRSIALAIAR